MMALLEDGSAANWPDRLSGGVRDASSSKEYEARYVFAGSRSRVLGPPARSFDLSTQAHRIFHTIRYVRPYPVLDIYILSLSCPSPTLLSPTHHNRSSTQPRRLNQQSSSSRTHINDKNEKASFVIATVIATALAVPTDSGKCTSRPTAARRIPALGLMDGRCAMLPELGW